jgi:flagellar biosynthetic protein FliR
LIDLSPFFGIGLLLIRPGALILGAPALGGVYAPAQLKIGLTVLLAVMLLPTTVVPPAPSAVGLAAVAAREMAIGLALAMAIRVLIGAAELAGFLASTQMGLSYSATVDPASGVRNTTMATLYMNVATITFLAVNAHHAFLRALGESYAQIPIGVGSVSGSLPQAVIALLGVVFSFGVRLAAPFIVVLTIVEVAMALVARAAPALNLMILGAPLRVLIGLVLVGLALPAAVSVIGNMPDGVLQIGIRTAESFR